MAFDPQTKRPRTLPPDTTADDEEAPIAERAVVVLFVLCAGLMLGCGLLGWFIRLLGY